MLKPMTPEWSCGHPAIFGFVTQALPSYGEWLCGEWLCGEWLCGEWLCGVWVCGEWLCGVWLCGEWLCGQSLGARQNIPLSPPQQ